MTTSHLPDEAARDRILQDLKTTFFVEAAAGTGKTTALVGRIVALLESGVTTLEHVVALTFTERAASEMKLRLREALERRRADADRAAAPAYVAALEQLETARIDTIHAFCAGLLRERPVEAGVDPQFDVLVDDEERALVDEAFDGWFQAALADPPPGVARVLRRTAAGLHASGPRSQLRYAVGALIQRRHFPAAWSSPTAFDRSGELASAFAALEVVASDAERAKKREDYLTRNLRDIATFVDEWRRRERVFGPDDDALEAGLRKLARAWSWRYKGSPYAKFEGTTRDDVLERRDQAKARLETCVARADADLASRLREELRGAVEAYERLKQRDGHLDFLDLLVRTRDLLRDDAAVRQSAQRSISHFLVDEFQDTDPLQAEILLLLSADNPAEHVAARVRPVSGKLFLVGDPKQAIYRFRGADVAVYEKMKATLASGPDPVAEVLHLTSNFRSLPGIQHVVNAAFSPRMGDGSEGLQAAYVPLDPVREARGDQPDVVALPVPQPYAHYGKVTHKAVNASYPDAVGGFVEWLVRDSGWSVDEDGQRVPVRPDHVCILFRRLRVFREDVSRGVARSLEARHLPHVLVGGSSLHEREEMLALRNALCAIEWPDDRLRVYATLRGPLFALSDDALLVWRDAVGSLHPLRPAPATVSTGAAEVGPALDVLRDLHRGRNRRPVSETIQRLLEATRAHAGIAVWPTGEQALANLLRLVERARRFESRGATSFRAFVERLEQEAEDGVGEEGLVVEQGTQGVRIMTVHGAKGLEFPVVILADPSCQAIRASASSHVETSQGLWAESLCGAVPQDVLDHQTLEQERDTAEAVRVAYVAATRARDLLVVPVVADARFDGWFDMLDPALRPALSERRNPGRAPNCPEFGRDAVVGRPPTVSSEDGVVPGLHRGAVGEVPVTWWDPHTLPGGASDVAGLQQDHFLREDDGASAARRSEESFAAWRDRRETVRDAASKPTRPARAVTAWAEEGGHEPSAAETVTVETVERPASQVHGARFGSLVHAVLASVSLDAQPSEVAEAVQRHARMLGSTADELGAAETRVVAALEHPRLRSAAMATELRREVAVAVRDADGALLEGVIDLAYRPDGEAWWVLVDFKTDRDLEPELPTYRRQLGLYLEAVRASSGAVVEGVLLRV